MHPAVIPLVTWAVLCAAFLLANHRWHRRPEPVGPRRIEPWPPKIAATRTRDPLADLPVDVLDQYEVDVRFWRLADEADAA